MCHPVTIWPVIFNSRHKLELGYLVQLHESHKTLTNKMFIDLPAMPSLRPWAWQQSENYKSRLWLTFQCHQRWRLCVPRSGRSALASSHTASHTDGCQHKEKHWWWQQCQHKREKLTSKATALGSVQWHTDPETFLMPTSCILPASIWRKGLVKGCIVHTVH